MLYACLGFSEFSASVIKSELRDPQAPFDNHTRDLRSPVTVTWYHGMGRINVCLSKLAAFMPVKTSKWSGRYLLTPRTIYHWAITMAIYALRFNLHTELLELNRRSPLTLSSQPKNNPKYTFETLWERECDNIFLQHNSTPCHITFCIYQQSGMLYLTPSRVSQGLTDVTVYWYMAQCYDIHTPGPHTTTMARPRRDRMIPLIARFLGPTWGPSGADRTQVGPTLAPWTLLSGTFYSFARDLFQHIKFNDWNRHCFTDTNGKQNKIGWWNPHIK